jgi:hypothetical protein
MLPADRCCAATCGGVSCWLSLKGCHRSRWRWKPVAARISVAAAQPSIGRVAVKSAEQQAAAMLLSVRELLVRRRTQLANAMRGHAAEMGVVAPLGETGVSELQAEIATADDAAVPAAAKQAIALLGREVERLETRLRAIEATLMQQHKTNPVSRRLAAIPGLDQSGRCVSRYGSIQSSLPRRGISPPGSGWGQANARPRANGPPVGRPPRRGC